MYLETGFSPWRLTNRAAKRSVLLCRILFHVIAGVDLSEINCTDGLSVFGLTWTGGMSEVSKVHDFDVDEVPVLEPGHTAPAQVYCCPFSRT